ncbi:hypothetical protein CNMCM5623_003102 [Aspergillus felis]|uniref:Uncharacterized protein n=1 Tax=Aspergillus felis TaxID=1287682 RepID=A0A8H6UK89_9EURO|nr:hypothetical protein CNMCM5623_003102 [Aspergillus felis]
MNMSNQPIISGKPGEDVDLYIDQCRLMWAGVQLEAEDRKQAIPTTLFVGLRYAALRFGRALPNWFLIPRTNLATQPITLDRYDVLHGWKLLAFFWKQIQGGKKAKGHPQRNPAMAPVYHNPRDDGPEVSQAFHFVFDIL